MTRSPGLGTLLYVANDFGRSKQRPADAEAFGTGHDLHDAALLSSPLANGGRVLGWDIGAGMYHTLYDFMAAVHACDPPYDSAALRTSNLAWALYLGAQQAKLGLLVLGRWVRPSLGGLAGIDDSVIYSFETMNGMTVGGSVVKVPDEDWSVLVNDAWVLGGVHSRMPFYLSTARTPVTIRNTRQGHAFYGQLTVLGREMTGLTVFGYAIGRGQYSAAHGEVAVCVDADRAAASNFRDYSWNIARYTADLGLQARLWGPEHGGPPGANITSEWNHGHLLRRRQR